MITLKKIVVGDEEARMTLQPANISNTNADSPAAQLVQGLVGFPAPNALGSKHPLLWDPEDQLFQPLQLLEETTYEFLIELNMSFAELEQNREAFGLPVFPFKNPQLVGRISFNQLASREVGNRCELHGSLNLGSESGQLDLRLHGISQNLIVEVRTKKVDYRREYTFLLENLAAHHEELILHLDGATESSLKEDIGRTASKQTQVLHLRRLMRTGKLVSTLSLICNKPAFKFSANEFVESICFANDVDLPSLAANAIEYDWMQGGVLAKQFNGYTPVTVPVKSIVSNFDIPENRFVKAKISWLVQLLAELEDWLAKRSGWDAVKVSQRRWTSELKRFQRSLVFEDVGEDYSALNSVMMLRRNGYREFFESMLLFELGLLLDTSIGETDNTGSLKMVSELYEIWCFFQIFTVLQSICGPPCETIEHVLRDQQFFVDLKKGKNKGFTFQFSDHVKVILYYVRRFYPPNPTDDIWQESYSTIFKPDFTIEIARNGQETIFLFFDAKYRLDSKKWKDQFDDVDKELGRYKNADLHIMHCYRDAILNSLGSYVLYPGGIANLFVAEKTREGRQNNCIPSIGAFPLKPSDDCLDQQLDSIRDFLNLALAQSQ